MLITQGGLIQIVNGSGPLSYHTPTPKDAPGYRYLRRARGEVCQTDLQMPLRLKGSHALDGPQTQQLIMGDASVAAGVADALVRAPPGAVLYDLTLDVHHTSFLGLLFRRQCLVVSGSLAVPWAAAASQPPPTPGAAQAPAAATQAVAPAALPADAPVQATPPAPALAPLPTPGGQLSAPSHRKAPHRSRAKGGRSSRAKRRAGRGHTTDTHRHRR